MKGKDRIKACHQIKFPQTVFFHHFHWNRVHVWQPCTCVFHFLTYRCCRREARRRCLRCRRRRPPSGPWWPRPCVRAAVSEKVRSHFQLFSTLGWETPLRLLRPFPYQILSVWSAMLSFFLLLVSPLLCVWLCSIEPIDWTISSQQKPVCRFSRKRVERFSRLNSCCPFELFWKRVVKKIINL